MKDMMVNSPVREGKMRERNTHLWFKILGGMGIHTILSSPFQGGLEPLDSLPYVPFRSSEIP